MSRLDDMAKKAPEQFPDLKNPLTESGAPAQNAAPPQPVVVKDIDMPFWSMVLFMIKWAFAAIPAVIILTLLGLMLTGMLAGMLRGLLGRT